MCDIHVEGKGSVMKAKKGIAFGELHAPSHAAHLSTLHPPPCHAPLVVLHLITLTHTLSPGELALLHNAPRAATVTAEDHVRPCTRPPRH